MKEDLFTFSIQQAETLGIECAIVLAAAKTIKTELSSPNEIAAILKESMPFFAEEEILKNINRLIDLKLISPEVTSEKIESIQTSYNEETRVLKMDNQRLRNELDFKAENERYL